MPRFSFIECCTDVEYVTNAVPGVVCGRSESIATRQPPCGTHRLSPDKYFVSTSILLGSFSSLGQRPWAPNIAFVISFVYFGMSTLESQSTSPIEIHVAARLANALHNEALAILDGKGFKTQAALEEIRAMVRLLEENMTSRFEDYVRVNDA